MEVDDVLSSACDALVGPMKVKYRLERKSLSQIAEVFVDQTKKES